jgi:hypothetical protein
MPPDCENVRLSKQIGSDWRTAKAALLTKTDKRKLFK